MESLDTQDVIIIGGGPAGMNAAVVLGRCRRKVLLFDTGQYRNRYSHGMHNYLTRDHIPPSDFLQLCLPEMDKYGVQRRLKKVTQARRSETGVFVVHDEDGNTYRAKKMLIATGLQDRIPDIPGFREMYGKSVHHCPYCDGWEWRDKKLGVYARNKEGAELALNLKCWSPDVVLLTDGKNNVKKHHAERLAINEVAVNKQVIERLEGEDGLLQRVRFRNGDSLELDALFFVNGFDQSCDLALTFGCEVTPKGIVRANRFQQTNIPGLYIAGDATRDMHFVVVAAAEGAKAGVIINKELQREVSEAYLNAAK